MSDLLEQATRALRETTSEAQPRSGLTRARLLDSAEKRYAPRRGGLLRWAVALIAALAASTALARVAQYWPEIKRALAPEAAEHSDAAPQKKKRAKLPADQAVPLTAAGSAAADARVLPQPDVSADQAVPLVAAGADTADGRVLPQGETLAPAPVKRPRPSTHRPKVAPREATAPAPVVEVAPREAPAPAPAVDVAPLPTATPKPAPESGELALFRRAQRLHLAHDPKALGAWDDYLRVASTGVLAPEAKYNRALCLIRLGRGADAKSALAPFANGAYGNFRRAEAKSLIAAIDRGTK